MISEQEVERRLSLLNQQNTQQLKEEPLTTNNLMDSSSTEVRLQ